MDENLGIDQQNNNEEPEIVHPETAQAEIEEWLDYKKVSKGKRESNEAYEEILVDAVKWGNLEKDEDFNLILNLHFPIGTKTEKITKLTFKPRLNRADLDNPLRNVKADDAEGRIVAYESALTGQPKGIIKKMDTEDQRIADAIAIFFIS